MQRRGHPTLGSFGPEHRVSLGWLRARFTKRAWDVSVHCPLPWWCASCRSRERGAERIPERWRLKNGGFSRRSHQASRWLRSQSLLCLGPCVNDLGRCSAAPTSPTERITGLFFFSLVFFFCLASFALCPATSRIEQYVIGMLGKCFLDRLDLDSHSHANRLFSGERPETQAHLLPQRQVPVPPVVQGLPVQDGKGL